MFGTSYKVKCENHLLDTYEREFKSVKWKRKKTFLQIELEFHGEKIMNTNLINNCESVK